VKSPILLGALLLAVFSGVVHVSVARPARVEASALLREEDKLRQHLGRQRLRVAALEGEEASRRAALSRLGGGRPGPGGAVADVRRTLLASIEGLALQGVQISVRPGRGAMAAGISLRASATTQEFVALSEALARPGMGIALSRARIVASSASLVVEIEGSSLKEAKP